MAPEDRPGCEVAQALAGLPRLLPPKGGARERPDLLDRLREDLPPRAGPGHALDERVARGEPSQDSVLLVLQSDTVASGIQRLRTVRGTHLSTEEACMVRYQFGVYTMVRF